MKNNFLTKHVNMELAAILLLLAATFAYTASTVQFEAKKVLPSPDQQKELEKSNTDLLSALQTYHTKSNENNITYLKKLLSLASTRKQIIKNLINTNPEIILAKKINSALFPNEMALLLEQPKTVEGLWNNLSANGKKYYIVRTATGEMYWIHGIEAPPNIPTESRVRINGLQIDDNIVIEKPIEKNLTILNKE